MSIFNRLKPLFYKVKQVIATCKRMNDPEFKSFSHIKRFSRECIITEKVDGTNAQIFITPIHKSHYDNAVLDYFYGEDGSTWGIYAGSRTRWVSPQSDNYGFAQWVKDNINTLKLLGPGRHYGEWYGRGINRNYGLKDRGLALFNVSFWEKLHPVSKTRLAVIGVGCVPVLIRGILSSHIIEWALGQLKDLGSFAVPGFYKPEGIVIYHEPSGTLFKKTLEHDDRPKGKI